MKELQPSVESADLIVTMTNCQKPFMKTEWLPKNATVIQMGPCEFETDALEAADVLLVDNWFQITGSAHSPVAILHKEGNLQQEDTTELRYVVAGMAEGRQNEDQQVMYCSLGLGAMDMIIANQIYKNAKEMGIGQKLMLWDAPKWV